MGSIYKPKYKDCHGNIKESKVYWIQYYRAGKPYRESSKSTKRADAKRLLDKREGDIANGKLPPRTPFDRVTFEELVQDFKTDSELKELKSWWRAKISVDHLSDHFEGAKVVNITTSAVKEFIRARKTEGASNASINRDLSALKRMFSLGVKNEKIDRMPVIEKLKEQNVRKGFLTHEDFLKLHKALPSELKPVLTFGYHTGWRRSEILNLTWDRVNLKRGTVRLEAGETKNDAARNLALNSELKGLFRELWNSRANLSPESYVFTRNGKKIKDFRGAWKRACQGAELEGILFHDLRRTGIRNNVRAGISEKVAMAISGHKTRSVFDRYNITDDRDLQEAARLQDLHLKSVTSKDTDKDGQNKGENKTSETTQVIEINQ